ncbi:hypothetical protein [Nafulsella turpanensis]|uniref:hypothetical protein n=1 Tax=Nafulsella turpanensis TaxID=1265690 RepID=UPI00037566FF|nr:hypothetical protein [Nafulsella turpanensis]
MDRRTDYNTYGTEATAAMRGGTPFLRRISWGAIIAGTLVALVTMMLLNLLGIGIGFGSINPVEEANPFAGLGIGTLIWWIVSNLIAIFAGGYVAGRMAGVPKGSTSTMHGILSWCLYTLVSFWILTTAVGSLISGVGSVVSNTISAASSGIEAVADNNSQNTNNQNSQNQSNLISFNEIKQEVDQLLSSRENVALVPDSIEQSVTNTVQNVRQNLNTDVNISTQDIKAIAQQVFFDNGQLAMNVERQEVVNAVASQTNLSEEEASDVADVMIEKYEVAKQEVDQFTDQVAQEAEETGAQIAEAASSAAIWTFVALALGAVVAGVGGRTGKPHDPIIVGAEAVDRRV